MSSPIKKAPRNQIGKTTLVCRRISRGPAKTTVIPAEYDRRHRNWGAFGKPTFNGQKPIFSGDIPVAMSIRMNDHINEIWIVKCWRRPVIDRIGIVPGGRPGVPQMATDILPIRF
jgi:hypothetical protein